MASHLNYKAPYPMLTDLQAQKEHSKISLRVIKVQRVSSLTQRIKIHTNITFKALSR